MKWNRGIQGVIGLAVVSVVACAGCGQQDAASARGPNAVRQVTPLSVANDDSAGRAFTDPAPVGDVDLPALDPAPVSDTEVAVLDPAPSSGPDLPALDPPTGDPSTHAVVPASVGPADHQAPAAKMEREPLFVDWPTPKVAIVFTGRQYGYLEPCGCSGLENQNGGLIRRSTLIQQLAAKGWPVIPIDAGNQVRRFGRQAEIKFQMTVAGLQTMGYRAIAFGPDDLKLPATELAAVIAPSGDQPSLFVSANVTIFDSSFTSPFLVIEKGGKRIGVTAILGDRNQQQINNVDVQLRPAEEALAEVWPKLQQQKCDFYVLIAHATTEESLALARKFPQFPLVVSTGSAGEPTLEPEKIEGTGSQMIQIGTKGMYACAIGLFDDAGTPVRYQRIPLDSRFPDSQDMLQLLAAYQDQLKQAGFDGLGIRPQPYPSGIAFAGSESCEECHEEEYRIWKEGREGFPAKHSHAYATLLSPPGRADVPRNYDPECLSCHVIGWNPQNYYPYRSGFSSMEQTPELINVGCENCHGPGAAHNAAENGDIELDEDQINQRRQQVILTLEDAEKKCLECHDLDNSPAFQEEGAFQRYWEKIKHGPDDKEKKRSKRTKRASSKK